MGVGHGSSEPQAAPKCSGRRTCAERKASDSEVVAAYVNEESRNSGPAGENLEAPLVVEFDHEAVRDGLSVTGPVDR